MAKRIAMAAGFAALMLAGCQGGSEDATAAGEPAAPAASGDVSSAQAAPPPAVAGGAVGLEGTFPEGFDPCDLITIEEAAEAAGQAVQAPQSETSALGIATCTFEPVDGFLPPVVLEVRPSDGAFETARDMAVQMAPSEDEAPEALDGVGERAFYTVLLGHNIVLAANGRFANLIVRENREAGNREQAIDLARRVAERLD